MKVKSRGKCYLVVCFIILFCSSKMVYGQCSTGCSVNLTASGGSGNLTFTTGDTLCINATSGNLNVNYTEVRLRPGSGMKMCSDPEDTIKFDATLRFFSGGTGTHSQIDNYGNFIYKNESLGYIRTNINNYGYWEVPNTFSQNTTGPPSFINHEDATLVVGGDLNINAGGFTSKSVLEIDGDFDFNGADFSSNGEVNIGGALTINSSNNVVLSNTVFSATDLLLNGGNFDTGAGNCVAFLISGNTELNSGVNLISGNISITDSSTADTIDVNLCSDPAKTCGGFVFESTNSCSIILPIKLKSLIANVERNQAFIEWVTTSEINNSHFIIQGSKDAKTFCEIDSVLAKGQDSKETAYQSLIYLEEWTGLNYIRLVDVDMNGHKSYSWIISLKKYVGDELSVYPNPVVEQIHIHNPSRSKIKKIELISLNGQIVLEKEGNNLSSIDLKNVFPGIYNLSLSGESKKSNFLIRKLP